MGPTCPIWRAIETIMKQNEVIIEQNKQTQLFIGQLKCQVSTTLQRFVEGRSLSVGEYDVEEAFKAGEDGKEGPQSSEEGSVVHPPHLQVGAEELQQAGLGIGQGSMQTIQKDPCVVNPEEVEVQPAPQPFRQFAYATNIDKTISLDDGQTWMAGEPRERRLKEKAIHSQAFRLHTVSALPAEKKAIKGNKHARMCRYCKNTGHNKRTCRKKNEGRIASPA